MPIAVHSAALSVVMMATIAATATNGTAKGKAAKEPVAVPVEKGQPIGRLKVWRGENVVLEVPLQATESVAAGSIPQRALDAVQELAAGLFRAGTSKL